MEYLRLKKDVILNKGVTNEGVLAYIALKKIFTFDSVKTDYVSVNRMAYELCGVADDYKEALCKSLATGLYVLEVLDLIKIVSKLDKNNSEFIIDATNIFFDSGKYFFTDIYPEEVTKIVNTVTRNDSMLQVMRYFITMVSTLNHSNDMGEYKGKVGGMTIDILADDADISTRSAKRYNDMLQDMKLIYIHKADDYIREGDEIKRINNTYSRYSDKDLCVTYGTNKVEMFGYEHKIIHAKKNVEKANTNRKLAQQYNALCNGTGDYSQEEIIEIYNYCDNMNKSLQKDIDAKEMSTQKLSMSEQDYLERLKNKVRDMSIFDQFSFLHEKPDNDTTFGDDDIWGKVDNIAM